MYSHWPCSARGALVIRKHQVILFHNFIIFTTKVTKYYCASSLFCDHIITFETQSLFSNVPYKMVHITVTPAPSRRWKKTATAQRVYVSKIYGTSFLWCCRKTGGYGDCLWRFLVHTVFDTDTVFRNPLNEWQDRRRGF